MKKLADHVVTNGRKNGTGTLRLLQEAADLLHERNAGLPVWVRAPKRGPQFYCGFTRPKLYELAAKGKTRSVSIHEPGQIRGTRLFDLQSILAFIESQCS